MKSAMLVIAGVLATGGVSFVALHAGQNQKPLARTAGITAQCHQASSCHGNQAECSDGCKGCPEASGRGGNGRCAVPPAGVYQGCAGCYADILARAEELHLSEEQQRRIERLAGDGVGKRAWMAADLDLARRRLAQLLEADKVDLRAVRSEVDKAAKNWGDFRYACIRNLIEARRILGNEKWRAWRHSTACPPLAGFARAGLHASAGTPACDSGRERRSECKEFKCANRTEATCPDHDNDGHGGRGRCHAPTPQSKISQ